jgi:hypothetical protein
MMLDPDGAASTAEQAVCELRELAAGDHRECDGQDCVYWRVLDHVGETGCDRTGCAISHFEMLADRNPEVAVWLLSVKRRMDELDGPGA